MSQDRKGFTLIELLIVVVIIGILATIAMSQYNRARDRALGKVVQNELRALAIQQEIYHHIHGAYADDPGPPEFVKSPDVLISIDPATRGGWAATATHPGWAGGQCGIYVGDAPAANGAPATQPGSVFCSP